MPASVDQLRGQSPHLSAAQIHLLLSDENNTSDNGSADHLARCEACQSKLTDFAGSSDWWKDARSFLSGEDSPRWEPDLSQASVITSDSVHGRLPNNDHVLELLGEAKHPEML